MKFLWWYANHTSLSRLARKHLKQYFNWTYIYWLIQFLEQLSTYVFIISIYHYLHHQLLRLLRLRFYRTYIKDYGNVFLFDISTDCLVSIFDLIINSPTTSIRNINIMFTNKKSPVGLNNIDMYSYKDITQLIEIFG